MNPHSHWTDNDLIAEHRNGTCCSGDVCAIRQADCCLCTATAEALERLSGPSEREAKLEALLRKIREEHMIQPSMLARNWVAYETLREIDAALPHATDCSAK